MRRDPADGGEPVVDRRGEARLGRVAVVDLVAKQIGSPPFDPRSAVSQFCEMLKAYGVPRVAGDAYAGQTFRADFQARGIAYDVRGRSASDLYEALEPRLNAGEVELLDHPVLIEQAICLVWRGGKITHEANGHDDHANAVAGLVNVLCGQSANLPTAAPVVVMTPFMMPGSIGGDDPMRAVLGLPPDGGRGWGPYS